MKLILSLLICVTTFGTLANDEDPAKLCKNAANLFESGDIEGALEEARWCVTQLEQLKNNQISSFFKDKINDFSGNELSHQSAMGMNIIEREYHHNDQYIQVTLTTGNTGAAASAFAALAQFGMTSSNNKVRIQRRNASLEHTDGSTKLTVSLKSGGMLAFESNSANKDAVLAFAKSFPVKALDNNMME
ncbi:hypothetical protein Q4489_00065 [Thalassotalea sp. 1_MG-2023]|uniref:hypothetical protein n=1 Tax=Thalassotalea sp. 1_MG-2023 TaxID=3062680 RepID=UPI0026E3540F|nr:hypothetical protein [Thalassotalea sp. 1_MG-2023]MDO6425381.1 hypothetical protein [Thalassotalea sp. 1_MG-2023]